MTLKAWKVSKRLSTNATFKIFNFLMNSFYMMLQKILLLLRACNNKPLFFRELWERNVSKNIWSCESDPRKLKKDNVLKIDVILQVFKALANKRRRRRSREMLQSSHHISQNMSTSRYIPNIVATPYLAPKANHACNSLYLAKDFFVFLRILFKTSYSMTKWFNLIPVKRCLKCPLSSKCKATLAVVLPNKYEREVNSW